MQLPRILDLSPLQVALAAAALLLVTLCSPALAQTGRQAPARDQDQDKDKSENGAKGSPEARGRYIVEGVARCGQCHTPRDDNGVPDRNHWLEGAAVWLKSAEPTQDWPLQAPRIAGNPPGTDAEMVTLLTTGIWRDGKYLRQPMPQFRMTRQDAEAVVAYLKSLPTSK
jgi:mono/diheme cytochrome c family protein